MSRTFQSLLLTVGLFVAASGGLLAQVTFTVIDADDADDGTCDVTHCSLREAINDANANVSATADIIAFAIAGASPVSPATIQPGTALPTIDDPVTMNGGLAIIVDGSLLAGGENGLEVTGTGGGSTIRGLIIQNFQGVGIRLSSGSNVVAGNRIGTDANGLAAAPNFHGVYVDAGAGNSIGGTSSGDRNIISGNTTDGVHITGTASGTLIRRNYIGLDATGGDMLPNDRNGVHIDGSAGNFIGTPTNNGNIISGNAREGVFITGAGATNNRIENNTIGTDSGKTGTKLGNGHNNGGGTKYSGVRITGGAGANRVGDDETGAGNVIGDSYLHGVLIDGAGAANLVRGNLIGTVDGTTHFGNHQDGVRVAASSTAVGGTAPGDGNTIAFQGDEGVSIESSATNVSVLSNSIYENATVGGMGTYLGIDLGDNGVTANDAGDGDSGANGLQNYPVLASAVTGGNIVGSLNSKPGTYRIEFFASPLCDESGFGEGKVFLGFSDETTDVSGDVDFTVNFGGLNNGWFITSTATENSNTSEFSACATVEAGADVEVTKTGPATVESDEQYSYTITVTNNGPGAATDIVVEDDLPGAVTYVSSSDGGSESGGTVTWNIANLANGASVERTVTVTAPSTGTLDNVVSATASSLDPDDTNNDGSDPSAQVETIVLEPADIVVSKSGPASVNANTNFTYTITVTNDGPGTATDVEISDDLPGAVTFVSATDGGVHSAGTVTWDVGNIANGASVDVDVTVTAPASGTLDNVASATTTAPDPDDTNNDGSNPAANVSTSVTPPADIVVTKSGATSVNAGGNLVYTITVTNSGPGTATNVVIEDALPPEVTFVTASDGGNESGGTVTWPAVASITNGNNVVRTVTVTAPSSGTITNTASATSGSTDPDETNNDGSNAGAEVETTVDQANIQVTKSGPSIVTAGQNFVYTITVTNNGPGTAAGVEITDVLPGAVTFVSASDGGSNDSGTVTWPAIGSIGNGGSVVRTVTVTAPPSGILDNVASATSASSDPDATNNDGSNPAAQVQTSVGEAADLEVEKTGPSAVSVGGEITYTITVTNNGPSTADAVEITDDLPAEVTFVSASDGGSESGGTVTWTGIGSIENGASVQRTVTVTAPLTAGTLENSAAATSTTTDQDETNNDGSNAGAQVSTSVGPAADVAVSKTGPAVVNSNATLTYTITLTNNGPSTADGVVLTDVLPAGVTFVSASNFGTEAGGTVTWPAVSLTNGQSVQRSVTLTAPATGELENVAQSTATTGDPDLTNNNGSNAGAKVTTTVNPLADVEVTKTGPAAVDDGETYSYTVTVVNHGPAAADNVVITDDLPAAVTFVSASNGGSNSGGTVTWPTISMLVGQSVQRTVTVTAPSTGQHVNVASATADTDDPTPSNNDGSNAGARVTTTIGGFTIAVSPATATVIRGSSATYTVTVAPATSSFADPVALSCSGLPAGALCTFNPTSVTPGSGSATSTLTVTTTAPTTPTGTSAFTVTGTSGPLSLDANANLGVTKDFALSVTPASATVGVGGSAVFSLTVDDSGHFDEQISFACSGLPAGASCAFSPSTVTPNGVDQSVQVTVSAGATSAGMDIPGDWDALPWWAWAVMLLVGLPLGIAHLRGPNAGSTAGRRRMSMAFMIVVMAFVTALAACSDSPTDIPDVTEEFTITGTAGAVQHTTTATLTIQM